MAAPCAYARPRSQVAATFTPDENALTRSAKRIPRGLSWRHIARKPSLGIEPVCRTRLVRTSRSLSLSATYLSHASVNLPASASGQIDFLFESELAHEVLGLRVSILPRRVGNTSSPRRRVLGRGCLVAVTSGRDNRVLVDMIRVCCVGELFNSVSTSFLIEVVGFQQHTGAPKLPL